MPLRRGIFIDLKVENNPSGSSKSSGVSVQLCILAAGKGSYARRAARPQVMVKHPIK